METSVDVGNAAAAAAEEDKENCAPREQPILKMLNNYDQKQMERFLDNAITSQCDPYSKIDENMQLSANVGVYGSNNNNMRSLEGLGNSSFSKEDGVSDACNGLFSLDIKTSSTTNSASASASSQASSAVSTGNKRKFEIEGSESPPSAKAARRTASDLDSDESDGEFSENAEDPEADELLEQVDLHALLEELNKLYDEYKKIEFTSAQELWAKALEYNAEKYSRRDPVEVVSFYKLPRTRVHYEARDNDTLIYECKISERRVYAKCLPKQKTIPVMNSWLTTPCNVRIPDQVELQNCPYLGDNIDSDKKEFLEELIFNFEGKLRAWGEAYDLPDPLYIKAVNLIWDFLEPLDEGHERTERRPPKKVFKLLGKIFMCETKHDIIRLDDRYMCYINDRSVVKKLNNLIQTDKVFTSAEALPAMRKFFCRRCLIYDCQMHDILKPLEPTPMSDMPKCIKACDNNCYMNYFSCLYFLTEESVFESSKKSIDKTSIWSNEDLSMLHLLHKGHRFDVCYICDYFPGKSCIDIYSKLIELGLLIKRVRDETVFNSLEELLANPDRQIVYEVKNKKVADENVNI